MLPAAFSIPEKRMKRILPAIPIIGQILGQQRRKPGTSYRLADHCLQISCREGTLLYHTLLGTLYLLEGSETVRDHENELLREHFFVPVGLDEQKRARDVFRLGGRMTPQKRNVTAFTILTTTDCNARCFYCYEMGRSRVPMSDQVAQDTAAYIAKVSGGEKVKLHWFGGEPLCNRRAIEIITQRLREQGVTFTSLLTTNGYYLDGETIAKARRDWKLEETQITLDGTRETYNRIKAYVEKDENAFERVLSNIRSALDADIRVDIRLNMDGGNGEDLLLLSGELTKRFGARENLYVYAVMIKSFVGQIHSFSSEAEAADRFLALQKKLDGYGFSERRVLSRDFRGNCCMADNDGTQLITPDGHIGRCEHFTETELVGSIYSEERDESLIRAWKELHDPYPECAGCPLYPGCIRLDRCEWTRFGCPESNRIVKRYSLERRVLAAYTKAISEGKDEA